MAYSDKVPIVKTWEWVNEYALRAYLWPLFLSIPLHPLRLLGLDYNVLVVNSIYAMNILLFTIGDYYLYKLAKNLLGRRFAQLALVYALFNCNINLIFQKTMTNGAESTFSIAALYYYTRLRPEFNRDLKLMTWFITLAFVFRSSSAVGWLPIIIGLFLDLGYFMPLIYAALFVAVPTILFSTAIDSYFYGSFVCPQFNFVVQNVVYNLASTFGTSPWHEYFENLADLVSGTKEVQGTVLFGFCMVMTSQVRKGRPGAAFLAVFTIFNLLVFSVIEHKEQRFISVLLPLCGIYYAFVWLLALQVERQLLGRLGVSVSLLKIVCKAFTIYYMSYEMLMMNNSLTNLTTGNNDMYGLLNGRSSSILGDYAGLDENEEIEAFTEVSSLFTSDKYSSAPTLWTHTPGKNKVTVTYNTFTQPNFMHRKLYGTFDDIMWDFPELKIKSEASNFVFPNVDCIVFMIREIRMGVPLPQLLFLSGLYSRDSTGGMTAGFMFVKELIKVSGDCYEVHRHTPSLFDQEVSEHLFDNFPTNYNTLLRLKPYKRCKDRMLKSNYYENNHSIGYALDFELSYQGYKESPFYDAMHEDGKLKTKYTSPYKEKKLREEVEELKSKQNSQEG